MKRLLFALVAVFALYQIAQSASPEVGQGTTVVKSFYYISTSTGKVCAPGPNRTVYFDNISGQAAVTAVNGRLRFRGTGGSGGTFANTSSAFTLVEGENVQLTADEETNSVTIAAPTPWVDVQEIGAVCDGSTDDAPEITAYIASISPTSPVSIVVPAGKVCAVKSPIILKSNTNLVVDGEIRALATYSGASVVQVGTADVIADNWSISGKGTIDAKNLADKTIDVVWGRFGSISGVLIRGGNLRGIRLGQPGTSYASYEVNVHDLAGVWYNDIANSATSIGVYHENCTDSIVDNTVVMGYRKGFQTDSGNTTYANNHPWARAVHGPFTHGFDINGSGAKLTNNFVDSPSDGDDAAITALYGYYIRKFNTQMSGNMLYSGATYATATGPAKITAVHIGVNFSSTSIKGFSTYAENDTVKINKVYDGYFTNVHITGTVGDDKVLDATNTKNYHSRYSSTFTQPVSFNTTTTFEDTVTFNGDVEFADPFEFDPAVSFNDTVTFNGAATFKGAAGDQVKINTIDAGQNSDVSFFDNDIKLWRFRKDTANGFNLERFDSGGSFVDTPLVVSTSTGAVNIGKALTLSAIASASAPNNSIFRDSADDIIKIKDNGGIVRSPVPLSGAGAPSSTPIFIGQEYLDTSAGKWYKAKGTASSADWLILN